MKKILRISEIDFQYSINEVIGSGKKFSTSNYSVKKEL